MNVHESVFIAPGAVVLGNVTLREGASVWYNATIRGDRAPIAVGKCSNIQDNSVVHVDATHPVTIGDNVTIGHGAIIHGCTIGDNTLVGMGAILMNGSNIGKNCIVGAGALVTQNMVIPDNSLVLGNPARIKRQVTEEEVTFSLKNARFYEQEAAEERDRNEKTE